MSDRADLLLISDFTIDNFAALLCKRSTLKVAVAPFDRVEPVLSGHEEQVWRCEPEWAMVWTRPERAIPAFGQRCELGEVGLEEILDQVDAFAARVLNAAERVRAMFVASWSAPPSRRGLGVLDMKPSTGISAALHAMNARLVSALAASPRVYLLDAQRWISLAGSSAFSPKLWYMSKIPFALPVFQAAADDVLAAIAALRGAGRKLVIVDLDDTLWGGIVGDDGWENLRLGGHDPIGEALVDFQRGLKLLARRGVLLGIVSKNDEQTALEAIRRHPEMVLREEDFAGWRINWGDKAQNIADLAVELNLGLQSIVFIDDHPHERARVQQALPEVLVPDWPKDKMLYRAALDALDCFDTPALTAEDRSRSEMYVAERHRRELQRALPSAEEWLADLAIHVTIEPYGAGNAPRVMQLLNRTNQMNLRTRRMTGAELAEWVKPPQHAMWAFRVRDRFGDSGLCGVLGMETNGSCAKISDFVLSCRVIGRNIERLMLKLAVDTARALGARRVEAEYLPTAKNRPCLDFMAQCGFERNGNVFSWDTSAEYPAPSCLTVEFGEAYSGS